MRALVQCALVVTFHSENVREAWADLYFPFSVKEDLAAADIVVSHPLVMHVV